MDILSVGQRQLLGIVSRVPFLRDNFIFTGGTALAACYLAHRYSEDLDFHTPERRLVVAAVETFGEELKAEGIAFEILKCALGRFGLGWPKRMLDGRRGRS